MPILAAHLVTGESASAALRLSVPVFALGLGVPRAFAAALEVKGVATLRPLLLLLAGCLFRCAMAGPRLDPSASIAIGAGLLGVLATAVHTALVQISLRGAASTAAMTTLFGRDAVGVATAR